MGVFQVHKQDSKLDYNNYLPISLLPNNCKNWYKQNYKIFEWW